jgi:hypothetical protein
MVEKKADERAAYQIRAQGRLDARWSEWFSGLTVTVESENPLVTTMVGVIDQAALRGILNKIWDLNLALISVRRVEAGGGEKKEETK